MRSASARGVAAAALAALATAVPAGGAVLGSAGRPAAAEPPGWVGGAFRTATGESVTVYASSTYAAGEVVPQQWAEFFAGIPHGSELGSVVVRIATPGEVAGLCGDRSARLLQRSRARHAGRAVRRSRARARGAARVRPPHRREPLESAVARRRLGAEAVGDGRARVPAVGAAHGISGRRRHPLPARPGGGVRGVVPCPREQKAGAALATWGLVDGSFYPDRAALRAIEQDVATPWTRSTTTRTSARFRAGGPRRRLVPRRDAARRRADRRAEAAAGAARHPRAPRVRRTRARARSLVGDAHAAAQLRRLRPAQTFAAGDLGRRCRDAST